MQRLNHESIGAQVASESRLIQSDMTYLSRTQADAQAALMNVQQSLHPITSASSYISTELPSISTSLSRIV